MWAVASAPASAFPWMVKHGYGSCAACHVDPSGSGQLTAYGRAQADVLVRFRTEARKDDEEVPKSANFLWFLETPEFLNLSGNFRGGALIRPGAPVVPLIMATDLYATVNAGPVVAHVTTGVGIRNTNEAAILPQCDSSQGVCGAQWIAREFWAGINLADDAVMIRAGRMNLPFGLRNNEHTTAVRRLTRTDLNLAQQVGVSAAYNSENLRGEVMGILGNFQLGPDAYRSRGYSAFAEYALSRKAYLGLSSQLAVTAADFRNANLPMVFQTHGAFGRFAPSDKIAVLAEADFLAWQSPQALDRLGFAALVQADFDLMQGLHLMTTVEGSTTGSGERAPTLAGWLSAAWYFLPHAELRVDNILRRSGVTGMFDYQLLLQVHFFL